MNANAKKRSLILAGGGIKVSFQAGVLQVWLDEAELEFDHVDGASGGVLSGTFRRRRIGGDSFVHTATVKSIEPDAVMDSAASGFV